MRNNGRLGRRLLLSSVVIVEYIFDSRNVFRINLGLPRKPLGRIVHVFCPRTLLLLLLFCFVLLLLLLFQLGVC